MSTEYQNEYKNKCELEVTACNETHTIYSNEVTTKKVVIRVVKSQDKECVFEGDKIEYTVHIYNDCEVDIYGAIFSDDIPEGLKFVPGSFRVNSKHENPQQPYGNVISYNLGELKAGSTTTIIFSSIAK